MSRTKFNEATREIIVENHRQGICMQDCAALAGIAKMTLYTWLKKGEKTKRGAYREFYLDMLKARAEFKAHHIRKIAENKSWEASKYLLQCVDPENYVPQYKQLVEAKMEAKVEADATQDLLDKVKEKRVELDDLERT